MTATAADKPWNPLNEPIDYAVVAGIHTPGLCDIVGANSPRKWDEREGYALSGATLWYKGNGLSRFSIKLRLYTDQDWLDWHAFRPLVERMPLGVRPLAKKIAKSIVHPQLTEIGVHSFVVEDLIAPERTDDSGEWTIEIKCIEFREPKLALAKPDAAEATPVDPVEQEIAALLKQNDALASEDENIP